MKKVYRVLLIVLTVLLLAACGKSKDVKKTQITDRMVVVDNVEDAIERADIDFKIPSEVPEGYSEGVVSLLDERIIQIIYYQADHEITYRTGTTLEDEEGVSGEAEEFQKIDTVSVGRLKVTLHGNGKEIHFAEWSDQDYSYSLSSEQEITLEQIHQIVNSI